MKQEIKRGVVDLFLWVMAFLAVFVPLALMLRQIP